MQLRLAVLRRIRLRRSRSDVRRSLRLAASGRKLPFKIAVLNLIECPVLVKADIQDLPPELSARNDRFTPVVSTDRCNIYTLGLEKEVLKMKQRRRIYYSSEQRNLMWDRWQKGDSMHAIARLFDRGHSSVQGILSETGGIRPAQRTRSRLTLTLAEREEISRGVVAGQSFRSMAASLGRAPSTISREIRRNGGRRRYRANKAEQAAWDRAKRPKTCRLVENPALSLVVASKLRQRWSPEQIAGWLKKTYPEDENYQVSHEIIYRSLYVQARGALKKELIKHLRSKLTMRHSSYGNSRGEGQGQIKDMVTISKRPASVEDRAVPGMTHRTLAKKEHNQLIIKLPAGLNKQTAINDLMRHFEILNLPVDLFQPASDLLR